MEKLKRKNKEPFNIKKQIKIKHLTQVPIKIELKWK